MKISNITFVAFTFQAMKIRCLRKLAENEISANGRNYYLTAAMVLEDGM